MINNVFLLISQGPLVDRSKISKINQDSLSGSFSRLAVKRWDASPTKELRFVVAFVILPL